MKVRYNAHMRAWVTESGALITEAHIALGLYKVRS